MAVADTITTGCDNVAIGYDSLNWDSSSNVFHLQSCNPEPSIPDPEVIDWANRWETVADGWLLLGGLIGIVTAETTRWIGAML